MTELKLVLHTAAKVSSRQSTIPQVMPHLLYDRSSAAGRLSIFIRKRRRTLQPRESPGQKCGLVRIEPTSTSRPTDMHLTWIRRRRMMMPRITTSTSVHSTKLLTRASGRRRSPTSTAVILDSRSEVGRSPRTCRAPQARPDRSAVLRAGLCEKCGPLALLKFHRLSKISSIFLSEISYVRGRSSVLRE